MFRRALCCALTALALWAATATAQPPTRPASPGARPPAPATSYGVSYRKPGASAWTDYRRYTTAKAAKDVARSLYQRGYEVQVLARVTLTRLPPRPKTADLPIDRTVTQSQARQVFAWM